MRVALAGESSALGTATARRLVVQREISEVHWLVLAPLTVASPKLGPGPPDGEAIDAFVWLAGRAPWPASLAARAGHVVGVLPPGREVPADRAALAARGVPVTCLRVGQVLGFDGPGPAAPATGLAWDEDVADAIALALAGRVTGAFDLVAEAGAGLDPARARDELGWRPRCGDAAAVLARWRALTPVRLDPRIAWLMRGFDLGGRFAPKAHPGEPGNRVGLRLTGADGGELGLIVQGVGLRVSFGPLAGPGTVVTMPAELLRDMLTGKVSMPMAELTGRARIEGEFIGWLVLGTMCQRLQEGARARGPAGWALQRYMAWLAQARSA